VINTKRCALQTAISHFYHTTKYFYTSIIKQLLIRNHVEFDFRRTTVRNDKQASFFNFTGVKKNNRSDGFNLKGPREESLFFPARHSRNNLSLMRVEHITHIITVTALYVRTRHAAYFYYYYYYDKMYNFMSLYDDVRAINERNSIGISPGSAAAHDDRRPE